MGQEDITKYSSIQVLKSLFSKKKIALESVDYTHVFCLTDKIQKQNNDSYDQSNMFS